MFTIFGARKKAGTRSHCLTFSYARFLSLILAGEDLGSIWLPLVYLSLMGRCSFASGVLRSACVLSSSGAPGIRLDRPIAPILDARLFSVYYQSKFFVSFRTLSRASSLVLSWSFWWPLHFMESFSTAEISYSKRNKKTIVRRRRRRWCFYAWFVCFCFGFQFISFILWTFLASSMFYTRLVDSFIIHTRDLYRLFGNSL